MPLSVPRHTPRSILVVRNDRLGDVLLTTPVAGALRAHLPGAYIAWLASPYAAPLLEHNPDVDRVLLDEGEPAGVLANRLRAERFDAAVLVSMDRRLAWAATLAGIPVRVGRLSSAWGLLLTRPVWQRRARGTGHEADHNLALLRPLGVPCRRFPTRLALTAAEREGGLRALASLALAPGERPLVIMHPGGGGSAPRWPLPHFLELGRRLVGAGVSVLMTAGPRERVWSSEGVVGHGAGIVPAGARGKPVFLLPGSLELRELAAVLAAADLVVSNSTGPLHMAVALGVPTLSVYPGVGTAQAFRWGPYPGYRQGDPAHRVFVAPNAPDGSADPAGVPVDALWEECLRRLGPGLAGRARGVAIPV